MGTLEHLPYGGGLCHHDFGRLSRPAPGLASGLLGSRRARHPDQPFRGVATGGHALPVGTAAGRGLHGRRRPSPPPPAQPFWQTLQERVFNNPYIWFICFGNFFVYVVRYVFFDWWPTYLQQQRAFSPGEAGTLTASFELAGLVGSLVAGWWSDRWRRNSVCMVYLVATAAAITLYSQMPRLGFWQEGAAIAAVGFCIYGPQFLVGVMVTDLASKEAAASAIGLTGFFGYLSTVASGWGLGMLVESYGWQVSFQMTLGCTLAALFFFALCGGKKS